MSHLPPTNDDRVIWDMWESQFRLPAARWRTSWGCSARSAMRR